MDRDYAKLKKQVNEIRKKLSKVKVGLPVKVEFTFSKGVVTCFPREKKWVVKPKKGKEISIIKNGRNDVTKYRAKFYLKAVISKVIKEV